MDAVILNTALLQRRQAGSRKSRTEHVKMKLENGELLPAPVAEVCRVVDSAWWLQLVSPPAEAEGKAEGGRRGRGGWGKGGKQPITSAQSAPSPPPHKKRCLYSTFSRVYFGTTWNFFRGGRGLVKEKFLPN